MDKATLVKDHLELASLYDNGKGVCWDTMVEASRVLSLTAPRVTVEQIKQARTVASFPPEVLRLFEKTGTNTNTRRRLIEAKVRVGWEAIVDRAKAMSPAKDSRERFAILSTLCGDGAKVSFRSMAPAELVNLYVAGLNNNRWKNAWQAGKELGCDRLLYRAIRVVNLPSAIAEHFPLDKISISLGERLIELVNLHGEEVLLGRMRNLAETCNHLTLKEKVARLSSKDRRVITEVRTRQARGKLIIEIHCDDKSGRLAARHSELLSILDTTIRTFI
jgi:hypothetical protein